MRHAVSAARLLLTSAASGVGGDEDDAAAVPAKSFCATTVRKFSMICRRISSTGHGGT